jgi:hypothetical protein
VQVVVNVVLCSLDLVSSALLAAYVSQAVVVLPPGGHPKYYNCTT